MVKVGILAVNGAKYTLKLGETYLIGVKSDDFAQDIEIDDASVDLKHCFLDCSEESPKIFDIRSKCGTFVDGVKIAACQMVALSKSVAVHFGTVEASLQLSNESDKIYPEDQTSPTLYDDSEIISNSPEHITATNSRLRHGLQVSPISTPNAVASTTNNLSPNPTANAFLVPTELARRSTASNASARSSDSFFVPETQCVVENQSKTNNTSNTSFNNNNQSKNTSTNAKGENDDFFIPETQEVVGLTDKLAHYPRVRFDNESINETVVDGYQIPSSQFRICTQEFNGSENGDSDNSEDILANVACSLAIPPIRYSPVEINKLLDINSDEEEIEKEMSALQWSKKTGETADASVTPDDIVRADNSVTPDIIDGVVGCQGEPSAQENIADRFGISEQSTVSLGTNDADKPKTNEEAAVIAPDLLPTQVFVKPQLKSVSILESPVPICNKENNSPQKDDSCFLAPTQVFTPPPCKDKPISFPKLPPPKSVTVPNDDLPPTQVFEKIVIAPAPSCSKNALLSSTLIDSGLQLSESSFRARCNKLLDSDDDEMDEIVAPEYVKQLQEFLGKPQQTSEMAVKIPSVEKPLEVTANASPSKEKEVKTNQFTPKTKFIVPESTAKKKSSRPQPAVSIDDFLYTPDFVAREFSKGEQLQELAEVKWKSLISSKQRRNLFVDDAGDGKLLSSDRIKEQDSANDLKPQKKKRTKTLNPEPERPAEKIATTKESPALSAERVSRRRKSTFPEERESSNAPKQSKSSLEKASSTNTKVLKTDETTKKSKNETKIDSSKDSNKKKEQTVDATKEKPKSMGRERVKLRRMRHADEEEKEDKTIKETSQSKKSTKVTSSSKDANENSTKQVTDSRHHINDKESLAADRSSKLEPKEPEKNSKPDVNDKEIRKRGRPSAKPAAKDKNITAEKSREDISKKTEEEKPVPRLTRLRSRVDSIACNRNEAPIEVIKKKTSYRAKNNVETCKDVNAVSVREHLTSIDLTESDTEETTKKASSRNEKSIKAEALSDDVARTSEKRKNSTIDASKKRLKSAVDITAPKKTSNSLPKPPKKKTKIAMTMCDPRYQVLLEKHSGCLWIYSKDPKECDVLVVEKGNRTYKLMVAIARGVPIVRLDWFVEVVNSKTVDIPFESYLFDEPEFQARHHFNIKKSLTLAKTASLFKGIAFMMTPGIRPIPDEMKDIVTCAGGTVLEQIPSSKTYQRIYLISQTSDKQFWHKYRRSNANIQIVTSDGVMASVMQQSEKPLIESIIQ